MQGINRPWPHGFFVGVLGGPMSIKLTPNLEIFPGAIDSHPKGFTGSPKSWWSNLTLISSPEIFDISLTFLIVAKFQTPSYNTFGDMIFFLVKTDREWCMSPPCISTRGLKGQWSSLYSTHRLSPKIGTLSSPIGFSARQPTHTVLLRGAFSPRDVLSGAAGKSKMGDYNVM